MKIFALDNIRSSYNVGSAFRILDGSFGKETLLLLGGHSPSPNNNVEISKTALGSENHVPWKQCDLLKELKEYKKNSFTIISIEESPDSKLLNKPLLQNIQTMNDIIFIFGSETNGISNELLEISDMVIKLPMNGIKNSLNVSSTISAIAYLLILS